MSDCLLVLDPGLFSTLQDQGRFGWQRFGISASGAMDRPAMMLANALVGNPPGLAVIETTLAGPTLRVEADFCRLAHAGMECRVLLNGQPVAPGRAIDCVRGNVVAFPGGSRGMRGYLAVAGGFAVAPVLGSLSTHTRSGLGGIEGRALASGDRLPLRAPRPAGPLRRAPPSARRDGPRPVRVRVVLGPQDDRFTALGLSTFLGADYSVSHRADRMGMQLDGPAVEHAGGFNIVSDGIVNGSIQVPGHGRPVILLADRQTTGGYPKIATVIEPDLPLLAQMRPGEMLRFVAISPEEAQAQALAAHANVAALLAEVRDVEDEAALLASERLLSLNLVGGIVGPGDDEAGEETPGGWLVSGP